MAMNRIQFQPGLSMPEFLKDYGTEAQCEQALEAVRWPEGFRCPRCAGTVHYVVRDGVRKVFQCVACRHQASLIAGTLFQGTKLPLTTWFLAVYLISQAKTGLSALALRRQLGVSYPTAWLMQHKLMQAMADREDRYLLEGKVQVDDAYLGGERTGGKVGRGSENKISFVAAVSLTEDDRPIRVRCKAYPGGWIHLEGHFLLGEGSFGADQHGVLGWPGLLWRRHRHRMPPSPDRHRRSQAQRGARVPLDQYRPRQSQDQSVRLLPCLRLPEVRRSLSRRVQLSFQPAL